MRKRLNLRLPALAEHSDDAIFFSLRLLQEKEAGYAGEAG